MLGEREHKKKLLIACSGPSLNKTLATLRRKRKKSVLVSVNGTHDYLIGKGIAPDWFVMCDPREDNVQFLRKPHKDVTYYIASQCHPAIFDALKGFNVVVWHMDCKLPGVQKILEDHGGPWCMVGGGSTVGLRVLNLAMVQGYRDFEYFGLDSCYMDNQLRAFEQENRHEEMIEFKCAGKNFICNVPMAGQSQDFANFMKQWRHKIKMTVHGNGLIAHINKQIKERYGQQPSRISPSRGAERLPLEVIGQAGL